jgi:hypothetical protein
MGPTIRRDILSQYTALYRKHSQLQFLLFQLMIGTNVVVVLTSMTAVKEVKIV